MVTSARACVAGGSELGWLAEALGLTWASHDAGGWPRASTRWPGWPCGAIPRRAHLLVSRVLGKHLPVEPAVALRRRPTSQRGCWTSCPSPALVLGLPKRQRLWGRRSRRSCPAPLCVLSTRRPGAETIVFVEEHSHAAGHRVLAPAAAADPAAPRGAGGRRALQRPHGDQHDPGPAPPGAASGLRGRVAARRATAGAARRTSTELAAELGVPVGAVSLLSGSLHVPADAPSAGRPSRGRG